MRVGQTKIWLAIFALLLVALLVSCNESGPVVGLSKNTGPGSIRDNAEAEEAALWVSGALVAPDSTYDKIKSDLEAIRDEYLDSIPDVAIEFGAWWVPSEVRVQVSEKLRQEILAGEGNVLDSLNTVFGATEMDTLALSIDWRYMRISFAGHLHPVRLAEIYRSFDDIIEAEPDSWIGDWSNVYPQDRGKTMTYLFRKGSGDCPAGCIQSEFWYFRRSDGATEYLGTFNKYPLPVPYPDWWDEARVAYERFKSYQ